MRAGTEVADAALEIGADDQDAEWVRNVEAAIRQNENSPLRLHHGVVGIRIEVNANLQVRLCSIYRVRLDGLRRVVNQLRIATGDAQQHGGDHDALHGVSHRSITSPSSIEAFARESRSPVAWNLEKGPQCSRKPSGRPPGRAVASKSRRKAPRNTRTLRGVPL